MSIRALSQDPAIRWDLLARFRLIEIIALWEGRVTTQHLCATFNILRQQASRDIGQYLENVPDNLNYDHQIRGYVPSETFRPRFTLGTTDEYLQLLHSAYSPETGLPLLTGMEGITQTLSVPGRMISPQIVRPLTRACYEKRQVLVDYISLNSKQQESRVLSPHTIVHTGYRWHVRAYCHKRERYADFVLSRFRGNPSLQGHAVKTKDGDEAWNDIVEIVITADPRLDAASRQIVEYDYGMKQGRLRLSSRGALVQYTLQLLRVDEPNPAKAPLQQQIIVSNFDALEPYLFQ